MSRFEDFLWWRLTDDSIAAVTTCACCREPNGRGFYADAWTKDEDGRIHHVGISSAHLRRSTPLSIGQARQADPHLVSEMESYLTGQSHTQGE